MPPTENENTPVEGGPELGITVPDDLSTLSDKELSTLQDKAVKAFDKINGKETVTGSDLERMGALVELTDQIEAESGTRAEAQQKLQEDREQFAARMAAKKGDPEAEEEAEMAADAEEEPAAAEPVAVEVPSVEEVAPVEGEAPADEDEETEQDPEDAAGAPDTIAASAATKKGSTNMGATPRTVAAEATQVRPFYGDELTIVASSDIPGVPTGKDLDREGLAHALRQRARGMGDSRATALVASLSVPAKWNLDEAKTDAEIRTMWDAAHDVETLVASGGWCAPSETIYDFVCDYEAVDGLVDIPTMTITRAGVRYPIDNPTLRDVFEGYPDNGAGFTWTEDDDIAAAQPGGPTKPCFTIPCPDFDETRLEAQGLCVTAGNLTDRAYPELTTRYVDLVFAAHAHRMNLLTLKKMEAASTVLPAFVPYGGAAEALLSAVELQLTWVRDVHFMAEDARLEVILPRHSRAIIRRDLARRAGVEFRQVTNSQIDMFFDEIGADVQFVMDWERITTENLVTWPTTVKAMIYPAGTHTRMTGGMIDLGVVRDSTLNSTNDYTAAWTEEFWNVLSRGCISLVAEIPVCPDGTTGEAVPIDCPTL